MNATNPTPDDHCDRLADRVLAEALGGERPPDLSSTILDRLEEQKVNVATVRRAQGSFLSWRSGALLAATAASLITCVLVLPRGVQNERDVALVGLGDRQRSQPKEALIAEYSANDSAPSPATPVSPPSPRALLREEIKISEGLSAIPQVPELAAAMPTPPRAQFGYAKTSDQSWAPVASPSGVHPSPYYLTDDVQYYAPGPGFETLQSAERWSALRNRGRNSASRDRYATSPENTFTKPLAADALSTFSIDVDTASYSNVRQYLLDMRQAPPAGAVRVEELVNYFDYDYAPPAAGSEAPFAAAMAVAPCPWAPSHRLVRIGVKGREVAVEKRPLSNLVFLVDVSGSMNEPNKLPLVVEGLKALTDKLGENDRVAIAVYAGSEGLVLPSTTGDQKDALRSALSRLTAGGSTAGGAGLRLAYEVAERHKITGGVNRVVLCTDGDFNVGMTGTEELAKFVETRAKETGVYLTVLGFGRGNLNDAMLEQISGRGDGHYAYIDNEREARRVLSQDLSGTLVTIAKDVKLQVEFNPAQVASYRLIGYENRVLAAEDFNNDAKDAGDIGAGHTVTALYEIVPVGVEPQAPPVDGLKYQSAAVEDDAARAKPTADSRQPIAPSPDLLTLKIRYKQPEGGASTKLEFPLMDTDKTLAEADADFRWAAAVAEFGMLLRGSKYVGDATFETVLERARGAIGEDIGGYRAEFLDLVRRAKELSGQ